MANDGTVKIGTELDDSGFKSGLSKLGGIASGALKGTATAIGSVATAAGGAVAGLLALESATEEYRVAQGKLNTAFEAAGYGIETAKQAYTGFYEILGDTDTATEASQLLAKLAQSEEDVSEWTNIAAGVFGTFGDSLPIEGLIESANETAKVGTVTGVLADALNWAGISEEEFNTQLAACTSESERNQLIMETLSGTYDEAAAAFYRNNEALIQARQNQALLDETLAKLGGTVSVVKNQLLSEFLPGISDVVNAFSDLILGVEGADAAFSESLSSLLTNAVARLPEFLDFGVQIITSFLNGIIQSLPLLVEAIPQVIASIATAIVSLAPQLLTVGAQILQSIGSGIATYLPILLEQIPVLISNIVSYFTANLPVFLEQGVQIITQIANGIISAIPTLLEGLPLIIDSIASFLTENVPALLEQGVNIILSIVNGIVSAIPQIIAALPAIIESIVSFISSNLPTIVEQGIQILVSLVTGIINAIPQLIAALPQIIVAIVSTLISNLPQIISAGIQILVALITGIIQAIPQLVAALPQIIAAIVNGLGALIGQVVSVGRNIVQGIWNGISGAASWLLGKIRGWCGSILNGIKSFFGIASPSKVFRDQVGYNIGLGVAKGIDLSKDEAAKAADDLAKEVYNTSKEWLDKQVKYYEYGLREQLDVWTAIQSQFVKESQQWADAEEQIQDIRHNIMQENIALEEEYQKALEDRANEIFKTYKLFEQVPEIEEVSGEQLVKNLEGQVASIDNFYSKLDELSQRAGVGETLLNEIRDMGPDAIGELDALLALSDEKLQEYADLYQQKQELAKKYAMEELADMREQTDEEIQKNVDSLNGIYRDEAPSIGQTLAEGIAQGIIDNIPDIVGAAKDAAKSAAQAARNEIAAMLPTASRAVFTTNSSITPASARSPSFAMENSIANAAGMIAMSNTAGSNRDIVLNLNGIEVARGILPDLRAVQSQSPAIVSDKR